MATPGARSHHPGMDPLSMVILAIGTLACLELAAANLRGDARRRRPTRATRARR